MLNYEQTQQAMSLMAQVNRLARSCPCAPNTDVSVNNMADGHDKCHNKLCPFHIAVITPNDKDDYHITEMCILNVSPQWVI